MASPDFSVLPDRDANTYTLIASGELDAATSDRLEAEIVVALSDASVDTLRIDLAGIRFLDSSGLSVLISAHHRMHERGGKLVLRQPSEIVQRLFDITQLSGELSIET
jgi:anti-sigma B factor antagonist